MNELKEIDEQRPDIRRLRSIPIGVMVSLAKGAPTQAKRMIREVIIRLREEDRNIEKAEISSHAQDAMMVRASLFKHSGRSLTITTRG